MDRIENVKKPKAFKWFGKLFVQWIEGFTLVELIVVITILAILATVGFLSLSGYSDDARTAAVKANVRTVYSAILTESTTSGNSPRYYVDHGTGAALSGAFVFVDGKQVALTGGNLGEAPADSNYTAGNPRWDRLRMNGEKFRLSSGAAGLPYAFGRAVDLGNEASAAYSSGELAVGAVDVFKTGANGRKRATPFFQVAGVVSGSKTAVINGNYAPGAGAGVPSLVRDPSSTNPAVPLVDSAAATVVGDETSGRKWSDGTFAKSCLEYASSPAWKAYAGSTGSGTYWIDPDGAGGSAEFKASCDMSLEGGGWTRVAASAPQGMIATNPLSITSVPASETLFKYVSGSGTYGVNSWTWDGILPQRICMKISNTWTYLSANGVTIPNGCENPSVGWSRFWCATSSAPQFVPSLRTGSTIGRTCLGAGASIAGSCFDYVIAPRAIDTSFTAFGDCEYVLPASSYSDNAGTLYYDLFVR